MKKTTDKNYKDIYYYSLENNNGVSVTLTNYGATVTSIITPDRSGSKDEITLTYDDVSGFMKGKGYFGATVGRYANRINDGRFELNGKEYKLFCNDGKNHLHGGKKGFDKMVWEEKSTTQNSVSFFYRSADGEEGYPGNLDVTVEFTLDDDNNFKIHNTAQSDKDTIVNLTNHTYFNLAGHKSGPVTKHVMLINADSFTPVDVYGCTTGEVSGVSGTPFDFRIPTAIGARMNDDSEQLKNGKGYDHNYIINGNGYRHAAKVAEPEFGRTVSVYTDKPCMQLYCGNFLEAENGKDSAVYKKHGAFCLETQFAPDSPNHKNYASPVLRKGEIYDFTTCYQFGIE